MTCIRRDRNWTIWVAGGADSSLWRSNGYAGPPIWSPDGTSIAFLRSTGDDRGFPTAAQETAMPITQVILISALGGVEKNIGSYEGYPHYFCWSADGKSLIVPEGKAVVAMSVENGEQMKILDFPPNRGYRWASLSPDEHTLALIEGDNHFEMQRTKTQIYLLKIGDNLAPEGSPRLLPVSPTIVNSLAWTPDSKTLIFGGSSTPDTSNLWRAPVNGDPPTQFENIGQGGLNPTIVSASAHHSERLVYVRNIIDSDIWKLPIQNGQPAAPTAIIASTKREWEPRYSPDGKRIVFASDRTGVSEIWIANADGSGLTQLTNVKSNTTGGARWSPDGKQIAFVSQVAGQSEIYMMDAQGGAPIRITNNSAHDTAPVWSPDGKWIYFASDRFGGTFELWRVPPIENGTAIQLTHHGGYASIFSADGNAIFYTKTHHGGGIWKQPLLNGEPSGSEVQILDVSLTNWGNFDVNSDGIAYVPIEQGSAHVYFYSFAKGSTAKLATFNGAPHFGISISRADNSIVFTQVNKPRRELILVENFK